MLISIFSTTPESATTSSIVRLSLKCQGAEFGKFLVLYCEAQHRKRQIETIALLEAIEKDTPKNVKTIHVVSDNISIHKGKLAQQWLTRHPRFKMHHTPVHCSWMNQIEQWFSILRRKRLRAPNFVDLDDLAAKIDQFVAEWNEIAHPFKWSAASFSKILEKVEAEIALNKAA